MTIDTRISLNNLTESTVTVIQQRYVEGERLGQPNIREFVNSKRGREEMKSFSAKFPCCVKAIIAMWGKIPIIEEESCSSPVEIPDA